MISYGLKIIRIVQKKLCEALVWSIENYGIILRHPCLDVAKKTQLQISRIIV